MLWSSTSETLFLVVISVAVVHGYTSEHGNTDYSFADYLAEYGKPAYEAAEHVEREATFLKHLALIRAQNALEGATWQAGLNEFTDWSNEEFRAKRTGIQQPPLATPTSEAVLEATEISDTVDWRGKLTTPVKNQGGCGSCWAFSATETLESAVAKATGKLLVLSPQQMVSCTPNPNDCGGTGGCQGATQQLGFNYTMGAGMSLESSYPYQGVTGKCDTQKVKPAAGNKGYVTVPTNNYTALATAVATQGPVAITVAAGGMGWQLYHRGVYSGGITGNCGYELDHGVQLVGYGSEDSKDYWIVRNSWGKSWGQDGYMYLRRFGEGKEPCGKDKAPGDGIACKGNSTVVTYCGECGILSSSSYPTGAYLRN